MRKITLVDSAKKEIQVPISSILFYEVDGQGVRVTFNILSGGQPMAKSFVSGIDVVDLAFGDDLIINGNSEPTEDFATVENIDELKQEFKQNINIIEESIRKDISGVKESLLKEIKKVANKKTTK